MTDRLFVGLSVKSFESYRTYALIVTAGFEFLTALSKKKVGRDSSVGIATRYGLDGPGIESRWGEIFRTLPDRPWGPSTLLYNGYRVFPGGKAAGAWL
jgi:hypothetical protein